MVFQCINSINIRQVPREVLKTEAGGLGFQDLPRDLAKINAWKTMFDPYIKVYALSEDLAKCVHLRCLISLRYTHNPTIKGILTNSVDQVQTPLSAASYQGLYCFHYMSVAHGNNTTNQPPLLFKMGKSKEVR